MRDVASIRPGPTIPSVRYPVICGFHLVCANVGPLQSRCDPSVGGRMNPIVQMGSNTEPTEARARRVRGLALDSH
jgi:hypothetical protein